jgi:hypothetical protein
VLREAVAYDASRGVPLGGVLPEVLHYSQSAISSLARKLGTSISIAGGACQTEQPLNGSNALCLLRVGSDDSP